MATIFLKDERTLISFKFSFPSFLSNIDPSDIICPMPIQLKVTDRYLQRNQLHAYYFKNEVSWTPLASVTVKSKMAVMARASTYLPNQQTEAPPI